MNDIEDYWGWNEDPIPVPGFGYFPSKVNQELDDLTEVRTCLRFIHIYLNYFLSNPF